MSKNTHSKTIKILIYILAAVIMIVWAYPFYYTMIVSIMPFKNYMEQTLHILPNGFTTLYFEKTFNDVRILTSYGVSFMRTIVGTILSVGITTMGAYALSKSRLKLYKFMAIFCIVPLLFWGGMIPYYMTIKQLHLINTFWGIIIPFSLQPFLLVLMTNFLRDVPEALEESAKLEGANDMKIFWSIIWPINLPSISVITLLYATFYWNEFYWASILISKSSLQTLTVYLRNALASSTLQNRVSGTPTVAVSYTAAVTLLLVIPVMIVYPFLQRYFTKGIMIGSVKG